MIYKEDFEKTVKLSSPEKSLQKILQELEKAMHTDIHDHMQWWACFNQKKRKQVKNMADLELSPTGGFGETFVRSGLKVGRNDPCPCDSGKKYKKCCLYSIS